MSTWTDEQLAAFTGGDLDASRTMALRAEMATNPELAARVERQRRVDALLDGLVAPSPDPAFSSRLRETTTAAVREVIGDELASRRAGPPAWTRWAMGSAAAALVLVVGVGIVTGLGGGGNDSADTAMEAPRAESMTDDSAAAGTMDQMETDADAEEEMAVLASDTTPIVVDQDEDFADDLLTDLADQVRDRIGVLEPGAAAEIADQNRRALGVTDPIEQAPSDATEEATLMDDPAADGGALDVARGPDVDEEDLARVSLCLAPLLASAPADSPVVPLEARLGTRDAVPAITYLFVGQDPQTGAYDRIETWVVDRATCEVLEFRQG